MIGGNCIFVRVFDKSNPRYYRAIVYAEVKAKGLNSLGVPEHLCHDEQYVVVYNPASCRFELIAKYDFREEVLAGITTRIPSSQYMIIQPQYSGWAVLPKEKLTALNSVVNIPLTSIKGYADVINNSFFLQKVLQDGYVSLHEADVVIRQLEDSDVWNYVMYQQDAEDLLKTCHMFHHGRIDKLVYEETDDHAFNLTVNLTDYYNCKIQLRFEGLIAMNLRTSIEYPNRIALVHITVNEENVLWADDKPDEFDEETTFVRALCLKWRQID